MEVTLSAAPTTTLFSISKNLHCSTAVAQTFPTQLPLRRLATTVFRRSSGFKKSPVWCRLECVSTSSASFASPSGDGEVKANPVAGGVDDVSVSSSDVIILNVGGMTCGGCAASVKRILENQAQVSSADVNLTTETAIVLPVSEAKDIPNWQKVMGEELAKHLTTCGFTSNLKGEAVTEGEPS